MDNEGSVEQYPPTPLPVSVVHPCSDSAWCCPSLPWSAPSWLVNNHRSASHTFALKLKQEEMLGAILRHPAPLHPGAALSFICSRVQLLLPLLNGEGSSRPPASLPASPSNTLSQP